MPIEQTLRYRVEIADALEKAHRQGIVHRDLKPGNVMLTTSGVKPGADGERRRPSPARSRVAARSHMNVIDLRDGLLGASVPQR